MGKNRERSSISYPDDVESLCYDWGRIWVLSAARARRSRRLSFGVVESKPGGAHELHSHRDAEEIIYVLSGKAELLLEGRSPQKLQAGAAVHVPPGEAHATRNTGRGALRVFIVYSPPGPEKSLRRMHGCRVLPPRAKGR